MITDPKLIIVRGLPGSGKSTYAQRYVDRGYKHVEADMFFMENGEYKYDRSRIKEAHKWCQDTTMDYLLAGHNVVVSNTFAKLWEIEPYLSMTGEIAVVKMLDQFENTHGVPDEAIQHMKKIWQDFKSEFVYSAKKEEA